MVPRKIITLVVNIGLVISPRFSFSAHSVMAWPRQQIAPPTQNARRYPRSMRVPGVASETSFRYWAAV